MRTNDIPFHFTQPEKLTGKSPEGLVRWVENFMTLLKPDNGIEWVNTASDRTDQRPLRKMVSDLAERSSLRVYDVRPAVYVNHGNCEGLMIKVDLLAGSQRQPLVHIKTFGKLEEAWYLAQNLSIVLELVLLHGEEPVIVDAVNQLGIRRYRAHEQLAVAIDDNFSLHVGEGLDRRVNYPLHVEADVRAAQREAIEKDLGRLVAAFEMKRIDASNVPPLNETPFNIAGIDFAAVRCAEPRPHWRLKVVGTGEVLMPGAGSISNLSVPKMKSDIHDLYVRVGMDRAELRSRFGLPAEQTT